MRIRTKDYKERSRRTPVSRISHTVARSRPIKRSSTPTAGAPPLLGEVRIGLVPSPSFAPQSPALAPVVAAFPELRWRHKIAAAVRRGSFDLRCASLSDPASGSSQVRRVVQWIMDHMAVFLRRCAASGVLLFSILWAQSTDSIPVDVNRGAAGLTRWLHALQTRASFMMITAHPDDEDGGMLALRDARRRARAAIC